MAKRLDLPTAPETAAYRAVVKVLREDPALKRINCKFASYDDTEDDLKTITASMCPYIELGISGNETRWAEANQHKSKFEITILLYVDGTNVDDMMNLWHVVRAALFPPSGTSERAAVDAYLGPKVIQGEFTSQPFDVVAVNNGGVRMLQGEGVLALTIYANT